MNLKYFYAIALTSVLITNGGRLIVANANSEMNSNGLSSELVEGSIETIECESGLTFSYDSELERIVGVLTPNEVSDSMSEEELKELTLKEAGNVLLNNSTEFKRIESILNGIYEEGEYLEKSSLSQIETIECESGLTFSYDSELERIVGVLTPNEVSDSMSEEELKELTLKEAGNVLLNNSTEFKRIESILNGTYTEDSNQIIQARNPYTITGSISPRGSRTIRLRGMAVGEKANYTVTIKTLKESTKSSGVTMKFVDENTNRALSTTTITSSSSSSFTNFDVYRPVRVDFQNNNSSSFTINGSFRVGF